MSDIYLKNLKSKIKCLQLQRFPLNFSCAKETIKNPGYILVVHGFRCCIANLQDKFLSDRYFRV